jgi:hypothetical protein
MSEKPQLKKKRKARAEKLHLNIRKKWESLIKNVDKQEVPINVLDTIEVSLVDGTLMIIDIKQLIANGSDSVEIEQMLSEKFEDLDEYILNVDFHVDIKEVQNTIQPETDKVLKNL